MMNEVDHVKLMKMVQDKDGFEKQAEEIIGKIYDLESEKTQLEEEML